MPTAATASTICLLILLWFGLLPCSFARDSNESLPLRFHNHNESSLRCTPFGICEPCPADALNQPFCRPFGNRRLVHCVNATESPTNTLDTTSPHTISHRRRHSHRAEPPVPPLPSPYEPSQQPPGELLAWESCGRIVQKERADFYEFVACISAFAILSLVVWFFRSRRVQAMQARQLAARIGIFREERRGTRV